MMLLPLPSMLLDKINCGRQAAQSPVVNVVLLLNMLDQIDARNIY